jgi:hypothetical protein
MLAQVKLPDDGGGAHIKHAPYNLCELAVGHDAGIEGITLTDTASARPMA